MTYILEWSYPYSGENYINIFDSEEAALKQACSEIVDHINETFDLFGDKECILVATDIQRLLDNSNYSDVVNYWNSSNINCDTDHSQYWNIYHRKIKTDSDIYSIGKINFPNLSDENEIEEESKPNIFVATESGAKCRCCNNYNEYAYADNVNGTYECYSCRSMKNIFS